MRLKQGDYASATIYHERPIDLAYALADYGAERLHLVDLKGSKEGKICEGKLFADIRRSVNIPCEVGGGIRSLDNFHFYFDHGFELGKDFVMVGSLPFVNRGEFEKILHTYAASTLLTVDAWGSAVKHSGWLKDSGYQVEALIDEMQIVGVTNFLVTQIKKDGMLEGPDLPLYSELAQKFPAIRLIASGGVSSLADLEELAKLNLYGAIVGRAYYEGKITAETMREFTSCHNS
ncbi:MAG: 1-(5-phosphoribosyl)-5-[(5-phosphoribosylamino)methylideneamino] imidazole-4-carboxamide isomerase [Spirochaetes bacterium]|nr:1-(5-phosphoribosyl)-5-[(5-phosphoribosylamino)methylideneamino] imidazole-4-carboxamide isomerase [Spirochaetota bacterium]